jgi:hypothetical protein
VAASDVDPLPRNPAGLFGCEEDDHAGYILRAADPA